MNVLIVCEYSGAVRDAFIAKGHNAVSCDLLPTDVPGPHFQGDCTLLLYPELSRLALGLINADMALAQLQEKYLKKAYWPVIADAWRPFWRDEMQGKPRRVFTDAERAILATKWDLVIAHPPCTYLCSSGLHWNHRVAGRAEKTDAAVLFVLMLWNAPVDRLALENPVGRIGTAIAKASQYVQPYEYGHDASKRTGLWLRGLPRLRGTRYVPPRITKDGKKRWANQTDSGQNKLAPSADRWKIRSETYTGIAEAMADQWTQEPTTLF